MKIITTAIAAFFCFTALPGKAATLFSTLGQTPNDYGTLYTTSDRIATDFKTQAQGATITGITAQIGNLDGISHNFRASIYSDNAGVPSSLVGTLFSSASLAATGVYTNVNFTNAGVALSSNSTYWIVLAMLEAYDTDAGVWSLNYSNAVDAGGSFLAVATTEPQTSTDSGASWADIAGSGNFRFSLTGTLAAVPEPARALFASLGCFALILRRRR